MRQSKYGIKTANLKYSFGDLAGTLKLKFAMYELNAERMYELNAERMYELNAERMYELNAERMYELNAERMYELNAQKHNRKSATCQGAGVILSTYNRSSAKTVRR